MKQKKIFPSIHYFIPLSFNRSLNASHACQLASRFHQDSLAAIVAQLCALTAHHRMNLLPWRENSNDFDHKCIWFYATASFFHVKIGRREPKSRTIETDHADKSKGNTKIINLRMDKVEKRTYLTSFYSCSGFYGNFNYLPMNFYFNFSKPKNSLFKSFYRFVGEI